MNRDDLISHFEHTSVDIQNILKAQSIAYQCLEHMNTFLKPGLSYEDIHKECESFMRAKGADGFWTHDDPALILFGDLSAYSAHESPVPLFKDRFIKENDFITIDVAPKIQQSWGDLARSYIMENGKIIEAELSHNQEIKEGLKLEIELHQLFLNTVNEDCTFEQLFEVIDARLKEKGCHNCDYHDNFGHSIENNPKDRITIAKGVPIRISEYNKPLTFEPHIRKNNGNYGIKYENMYVFYQGKMRLLSNEL